MTHTIYETAVDTAKKIRKALKEAFPGAKFFVRSETVTTASYVHVRWTDGPMKKDVDEVLKRFKSQYFNGELFVTTGYEWEGRTYNGAEHIDSHRFFSPDRKAVIMERLHELCKPYTADCFKGYEWHEAELQLIQEGKL